LIDWLVFNANFSSISAISWWKNNNKGNAKLGISPCLKIWPGDLDLWPWKSIGFQILLSMYQVWTDGSITISLCNFVGEGIIKYYNKYRFLSKYVEPTNITIYVLPISRNPSFKIIIEKYVNLKKIYALDQLKFTL
jgi:hypothetical protein